MNPPTEQLIRDYLNRLSVAARGQLGFSERQSLLDRTRARIEAECGGINGAGAAAVRKALAGLGDPIALVELELGEASGKAIQANKQHDLGVTGNGHEMAVNPIGAAEVVKRNEIGKDLLAADGPNGSEPARVSNSGRVVRAGFTSVGRRQRKTDPTGVSPGTGSAASASAQSGDAARISSQRRPASASERPLRVVPSVSPSGVRPSDDGPSGVRPSAVRPSGVRPSDDGPSGVGPSGVGPSGVGPSGVGPSGPSSETSWGPAGDLLAALDAGGASGLGIGGASTGTRPQTSRFGRSAPISIGATEGLLRGALTVARGNKLEVLAVLLLGVGGAVFPPVWLLGALLALPSRKWDIRDKFLGITLPVIMVILGIVLILIFGGQHDSISTYAHEAWLGAGRLTRALTLAGAIYLLWGLRRGRREPKQPPWNVPHRLG